MFVTKLTRRVSIVIQVYAGPGTSALVRARSLIALFQMHRSQWLAADLKTLTVRHADAGGYMQRDGNVDPSENVPR